MNRIVISSSQQQNGEIILTQEQEHYLKRVLRLGKGDRFIALDGEGKTWLAELTATSAQILQPLLETTELPVNISLMVALPKGDGFEDIVRACTELGVNNFLPVISSRTLLKPSLQKLERWRKIATEAAEQSERQIVPKIMEPKKLEIVLQELVLNQTDSYICVARNRSNHLVNYTNKSNNIIIATGPEGGFTTEEISLALIKGFKQVSLGNRILRAVTAPIVAVSLIAAYAER